MADRFRHRVVHVGSLLLAGAMLSQGSQAQVSSGGRFDLVGPKVDVHVQRGDKSLPVSMVPNLQGGDKLTVHAELPSTQSVKLILVVAFLRGTTNPPSDKWFTKINTWERKVRDEGVVVTVPDEAQQALIFIAPETGGDYSTLKSAVMGRPGVFVRASQDLNEASFEQARIERYLQAIRRVPPGSPAELLDHSHKLAATLNLKPNEDCFKKPADQQLTCLRQSGSQVLLDDGHGQTLASMITNGDSANLIGAVAGTPVANAGGAGSYSAYVGTVIDVVRLLSGLHTAHFQYIPAIAFPDENTLNLRLNTPPSFHNPKSVIVVALPAIQQSVTPPLRLQDPGHVSCLLQPAMVLPLQGAPLVFATSFAHDMVLHLNGATLDGRTDLPLSASAFEGGLVLTDKPERQPLPVAAPEAHDAGAKASGPSAGSVPIPPETAAAATAPAKPDESGAVRITGTLRGQWGFDPFEGITVPLQRRDGTAWAANPDRGLFAGRSNQLTLHADGVACASRIELDQPGREEIALTWKQASGRAPDSPPALELMLPLEKAAPGNLSVAVHQFGTDAVTRVAVTAYADTAHLEALHIHAGDSVATLSGTGLHDVQRVRLNGVDYKPAQDQPGDGKELRLSGAPAKGKKDAAGKAPLAAAGETGAAEALLADGRTLPVRYVVDAARPALAILSKTAHAEQNTVLQLAMDAKDDLPLNSRITVALRSESPARFPRTEKIEVALADNSLHTTLSVADGTIVLQDAQTALAFFSPAKDFGGSAFGPLQLRAVAGDGTPGDWIPLGRLVRMPALTGLVCTRISSHTAASGQESVTGSAAPDTGCTLSGKELFLVGSVSADSAFTAPVTVPLGFAGDTLSVPRPADNRTLYLKLRDDPGSVVTLTLAQPLTGPGRKGAAAAQSTPPPSSPE